jgi:hypothetical protein
MPGVNPMSQAPRPCSLNGFSIQGHASSLPWARGLFQDDHRAPMLYDDCMAPLLQINELRIRFASVEAVCGISLHVDEGEVLGLVGESGSGKSATALSILGLYGVAAQGLRPNPVARFQHSPPAGKCSPSLARPRDRHDLPGADDRAQSRHVHRPSGR